MARYAILLLPLLLAGCLNADQARVTPEYRQLKNRAAIVVLVDPQPRLVQLALQPTESTHTRAVLPGWQPETVIGSYLAERMRGKGLTIVPLPYEATDFKGLYTSSAAYADTARIRDQLCAMAAAAKVDMLVVVYRLVQRDFVGDSVENLVGYGLLRHTGGGPQAYAALYVEALDVSQQSVIGNSDGLKAVPLDADAWRESYGQDAEEVAISAADAPAIISALTSALHSAVLTAAQEAGLSN